MSHLPRKFDHSERRMRARDLGLLALREYARAPSRSKPQAVNS
jgi:hypothetical protein